MDKIMSKLLDLENERECLENCQKKLIDEINFLDGEESLEKEMIYYKNRDELKEVNKKIETLNDALDIVNNIK